VLFFKHFFVIETVTYLCHNYSSKLITFDTLTATWLPATQMLSFIVKLNGSLATQLLLFLGSHLGRRLEVRKTGFTVIRQLSNYRIDIE